MEDLNIGVEDNGADKTLRNLASALTELKRAFDNFASTPVGNLAREFEKLGASSAKMASDVQVNSAKMASDVKTNLSKVSGTAQQAGRDFGRKFDQGIEQGFASAISPTAAAKVKDRLKALQGFYEAELGSLVANGKRMSIPVVLDYKVAGVQLDPSDRLRLKMDAILTKTFSKLSKETTKKGAWDSAQQVKAATIEASGSFMTLTGQEKHVKNAELLMNFPPKSAFLSAQETKKKQIWDSVQQVKAATIEASGSFMTLTGQEKHVKNAELLMNFPPKSAFEAAKAEMLARVAQVTNSGKSMVAQATRQPTGVYSRLSDRSMVAPAAPVDASTWGRSSGLLEVFRKSARGTTADLADMHSAARGVASGFNAMWLTWGNMAPLLAGAALSNGFVQAVKRGSEFANTLEEIRVLGGESYAAVDNLTQKALELGRSGPQGPLEIAQALKTLSLAGLNATEQLHAIGDVRAFANVGGMELGASAQTLVAVASAYGYTADKFNLVGDVIAKTAAISMASVESMSEAFKQASVIAQQYGVSLQDTSTMLATLSQVGIQGTAAGTSVRNMYTELLGNSKKASQVLNEVLKVDVWDSATNSMKPVVQVMDDLLKSLSKFDGKSQQKILNDLGDERGMKAIAAGLEAMRKSVGVLKSEAAPKLAAVKTSLDWLGNSAGVATLRVQLKDLTAEYERTGQLSVAAMLKLQNGLLSAAQKSPLNEQIGGDLEALRADIKNTEEVTTKALEETRRKIAEAPGYMALANAQLEGTTAKQFKAIGANLESALVEAFSAAEPAVRRVIAELQGLLNDEGFRSGMKVLVESIASAASTVLKYLPTIALLGTAFVAVKLAAGAMSLAVGTATALTSGITAVSATAKLALDSKAWAAFRAAEAAKGLAAGNAAASTAMYATGVAAGRAAIGLRLVMGALGPLGAMITAVTLLWEVYNRAKGDASKSTESLAADDAFNQEFEALKRERDTLKKKVDAMKGGASSAAASAEADAEATMERLRRNGQRRIDEASRARDEFLKKNPGADVASLASPVYAEYRGLQTAVETTAQQLKEAVATADQIRSLAKEQDSLTSDELRRRSASAAVGTETYTGGDEGKGRGSLGALPRDNEIKELEKRLNLELSRIEDFTAKRKTILDNARQSEALSQGQYSALELAATVDAERNQLQAIEKRTPEILNAYSDRAAEIRTKIAEAEANKSVSPEQRKSAVARLRADLDNLNREKQTFNEGLEAKREKVHTSAEVRIEKIKSAAIGAVNRLKEEEREYAKAEGRKLEDLQERTRFESGLIGMAESRAAVLRAEYDERKRLLDMDRQLSDELQKREQELNDFKAAAYANGPLPEGHAAVAQISAGQAGVDALRGRLEGRRSTYGEKVEVAGVEAASTQLAKMASIDLASVFDKASVSINGMKVNLGALANQMVEVASHEETYAKLKAQAKKEGKSTADLDKQIARSRINDGASMIGMVKSYAKEGTKTFKALQAAEQVYHVAQLAMGMATFVEKMGWLTAETTATVASEGIKTGAEASGTAASVAMTATRTAAKATEAVVAQLTLPFPANIPAVAMVVGMLAALGVATGAIGGTKGSFGATNEGKGTVLGDSDKASESIPNSIKLLDSLNTLSGVTLEYTRQMAASLQNMESQMGGVASLMARNGVAGLASAKVQTGLKLDSVGKMLASGGLAGAAIGSVVGSILGGPLGLTAGAVIGKAIAKGFGTSTKIKGQGVMADDQNLGDILSGGLSLDSYADVRKKKKAFGITYKTNDSVQRVKADSETSNQFTGIIRNLAETVATAAGPIFGSVEGAMDKLQGFTVSIGKIKLDGLTGDQVQERLNAVFSAEGDKMAKFLATGLEDFQLTGEGMYETLIRVSSTVVTVNDAFDSLGYALRSTNLDGAKWAVGLTDAFGGMDKFQSTIGKYYESFYTEQERTTKTTQRLTQELTKLGVKAIPTTTADYRKMVDQFVAGNDMTTEAAQATYAQMIQLSEPFASVTKAVQEMKDEMISSSQDIMDYVTKLKGDRGDLATPAQKLEAARTKYITDLTKAKTGDVDAMKSVTSSADSYIQAQKDMTASSDYTQAVIDQIIAELTNLGDRTKTGVPAFAKGGYHSGGWAMVGEEGPELAYFDSPARIYTAKQTSAMGDNSELVSEVRALRQEVSSLRAQQSQETQVLVNSNVAAQQQAAGMVVDGVKEATERQSWVDNNKPVIK